MLYLVYLKVAQKIRENKRENQGKNKMLKSIYIDHKMLTAVALADRNKAHILII